MLKFCDFGAHADGLVDFERFKELWDHLGAGREGLAATATELAHPLWLKFAQFDLNGRGHLSQYEVRAMLESMGHAVDPKYLAGLMETFEADFDTDGNGVLDFKVSDNLLVITIVMRYSYEVLRKRRARIQGVLQALGGDRPVGQRGGKGPPPDMCKRGTLV